MEIFSINFAGKVRKEKLHGRDYLVAPMVLIRAGVLNGSQGALFYPPHEIKKNASAWNGIPLTVGHPTRNGQQMSGRDPSILNESGIGHVYHVNTKGGKLQGEGWFDVEAVKKVDNRIYDALINGRKIELSTGLFTENHPASRGASFNGKPYTHIARNYRPDHLAILPDQVGACSVNDGCGVNVNAAGDQSAPATECKCGGTCEKCAADSKIVPSGNEEAEKPDTTNLAKQTIWHEFGKLVGIVPTDNAFCPTGSGGGQDNSCSSKGGGGSVTTLKSGQQFDNPKANDHIQSFKYPKQAEAFAKAAAEKGFNVSVKTSFKNQEVRVHGVEEAARAGMKALGDTHGRIKSMWEQTSNAEYEKSYNDRQSELATQLNKRFPPPKGSVSTIWVSDLYDDYLIYQKNGLYFRLGYVEKGGNCVLSKDKPVRVDRVTTYEEVDEKTENALIGQPKSLVSGRWKRSNAGTGKGEPHEAAQRGALYLDTDDHAKGASAKAEIDAGYNPPSWVEDDVKWIKATTAANKGEYDADTLWAVVTHIYKQMGGSVKGDTIKNTAKKTKNSSVGNRSHSARRQRSGTKPTGVLNMKRDDVIDSLVTNCDCFDEEDRDTLNSLDDKKLKKLHHQLVDNALYEDEEDEDEEVMEEEEEEMVPAKKKPSGFFQKNRKTNNRRRSSNDGLVDEIIRNRKKPQTADEWFSTAPPEIQSAVRNAMTLEQQSKKALLDQLTANVADDQIQRVLNQLKSKSINELQDLLSLLPPARAVAAPSFIGASVPAYPGQTNNERALDKDDDDILPIPTINYQQEYAERASRKAVVKVS